MRTFKGRRQAVDNIAAGSKITTQERTIYGSLPPTFATSTGVDWGNAENIASASDYGKENIVTRAATLMLMERLGSTHES